MRLLCDQMLGSLAKWLRLLGFDTFYASAEITDDALLEIARKENRVLISRDKELLAQGRKENIKIIEIKTTDLDDQLLSVLHHLEIDENMILSRCTICNQVLEPMEKMRVKGKVPEKVFDRNEQFWYCCRCDKVYWSGSHYQNIIEKIAQLKEEK